MDLPSARVWFLSAVFAIACNAASDDAGGEGGAGNAASGGTGAGGSSIGTGGSAVAASGGSDAGGVASGNGSGAGEVAATAGTANAGGVASGNGSGAGGVAATAGTANAGGSRSSGGRSSGGAPSSMGGRTSRPQGGSSDGNGNGGAASTAGAGSCVQNLTCMLAAPPSSGDIHQDCVDRINQFRTQCACLPALARWTDGEACADRMAQYDSEQDSAHAGYDAKICSGGRGQNECPGWGSNSKVVSGCLQQMWNEGPAPTSSCTGDCFKQHGHFINMTSTSATKVACGFYTMSSGKVWAVQNFSR